jgi:periplasmic protein TonB
LRAGLPISAAAHAAIVAALLFVPLAMPAPSKIDLSKAVEVVFAPPPAPPQPPTPQPPAPEPPKPAVLTPPPLPEPPPPPQPQRPPEAAVPPPPPPITVEPPPPAPVAEIAPPPPPEPKPKPSPKPRPRPVRPVEQAIPQLPLPLPLPLPAPAQAPMAAQAAQTAALPPPAPVVTPDYRSMLSGWLESHKRYPDAARQRGEEGRAVLRFRVARSGQVLDYTIVNSTGFSDLDAAVENMMRGAVLPPFPAAMPQPEIEVSVTIRFGLSR